MAPARSSRGQSIEVGKHLFGMASRVHFLVSDENVAVGTDQVGDALGIAGFSGVRGPVGQTHGARRVAEKREGKRELAGEGVVLFLRIETDTENLAVAFVELTDSITESVAFDRSARGIGFGIEPEEDVRARKICERDRRSLVCLDREGRCALSGSQHGGLPQLDEPLRTCADASATNPRRDRCRV